MNEKTTLIIDDDESIGNFEQELLQRSGYAVLRAYSGTPVSLTRTEYAILKILMQSAGQVIAKLLCEKMGGSLTADLTNGVLTIRLSFN